LFSAAFFGSCLVIATSAGAQADVFDPGYEVPRTAWESKPASSRRHSPSVESPDGWGIVSSNAPKVD